MSDLKSTGRDLRALWATLAMICLLGAAVAYGVTRYRLMEVEEQAGRDARKLAVDVIQPALTSGDVSAPIRGERLAEVRSSMQADLLAGPVNAVRIWSGDGTIVFADDPEAIGEHDPAIRDEIRTPATGTTVHGFTTGQRFHSLVVMHVGDPPTLMAAELIRPHEALVAKAEDPWYPWVSRAIWLAIAFAALYVVTWVGFAVFGILRRGIAHRKTKAARERPSVQGRRPAVADENLPAYMQPGFRAEVESRERVEQELSSTAAERDELAHRLQQAQLELQRSTASSGVESA